MSESPDRPIDASRQCPTRRLKEVFLFREWSEEDLATVIRHARLRRHKRGDLLFLQGDACGYLYVLLSGAVQMFRTLPDGREITLHELSSGAVVACAALFLDRSYPASARVLSREAELLTLEGSPFLRLLAERPDLARKLIAALAGRITDLADRIESRTADSATVRLAGWLLDQPSRAVDPHERVVRIEGTKKSVAASLGMTPETFSRTLKAFSKGRVLEVRKKEILLKDLRRLGELAEEG